MADESIERVCETTTTKSYGFHPFYSAIRHRLKQDTLCSSDCLCQLHGRRRPGWGIRCCNIIRPRCIRNSSSITCYTARVLIPYIYTHSTILFLFIFTRLTVITEELFYSPLSGWESCCPSMP